MRKNLLFWILMAIMAAGVFACHNLQQFNNSWDAADKTLENSQAPGFILANLAGEDISLADFHGNVVLLNFWTTWCPYCKLDLPVMDSLYVKYKEKGFVVLAVNVTALEKTTGAVEKVIAENDYSFPVLLDKTGDVALKYEATAFPTSFIINQRGEIVYSKIGSFSAKEMEAIVKKLL
ncbi:MAG: TlpA disulfide reductase family protein [Bacillota bacterium]|jgi:peroxiredoxin